MQGTGAPEPYVLERLAKGADNFILCFDGDAGGKNAIKQFISAAGPLAKRGDIQINVATLPEGQDPDEICRNEGVMAFHNITSTAVPWLDWVIEQIQTNSWGQSHMLALEYGGIGEFFSQHTDKNVIAEQVPRLYQICQHA